jgi:YhcH/YjgK/YiaL family protein
MIVAALRDVESQAALTPGLRRAVAFLRRADVAGLPDGRLDIDADRVFALVQRYETVAEDAPRFEGHRRYIDVQYLVAGEEVVGWAPAARMAVTAPYDAAQEACFGTVAAGDWSRVLLRAGEVAVLHPEDAHAPKLAAGRPSPVHKIVVKVSLTPNP